MKKWSRLIVVAVLVFGLVNVGIGAAFIGIGASKQSFMKSAMTAEQIALGLAAEGEEAPADEYVDTMGEAQQAGDIVREHRHGIAPTYGDLLGGARYDPTNLQQLSYAQAMNIENYLYLATNSFGVTYLSMGVGVALVLTGIALMAVAIILFKWARRVVTDSAATVAGPAYTAA